MALGVNKPRGDRRIKKALRDHKKLMDELIAKGYDREEASRIAYADMLVAGGQSREVATRMANSAE